MKLLYDECLLAATPHMVGGVRKCGLERVATAFWVGEQPIFIVGEEDRPEQKLHQGELYLKHPLILLQA